MAVFTLETLKSTTKRRTVTETNQAAALIGGPKLRKDRQLGQTSNLRRVEPELTESDPSRPAGVQ